MPNPVFDSPYVDSVAERGKFVALDMSDTTTYPASGMGKYAVLVYDLAGGGGGGGTSSLPNKIVSYQMTVNATVSSITVANPVTFLEVYNRVVGGSSTAYILLSTSSQVNTTAIGIPIPTNGFYSITDVLVSSFTIATDGNSDLRIIGHYK